MAASNMLTSDEKNWWPWAICGLLLLATMLNYMDRQALSIVAPTLKTELGINDEYYGAIEGKFGYAFAAGSLFFGFLADRLGPRYLYPFVLAGWSLAGIATAAAGNAEITDRFRSLAESSDVGIYRFLLTCRIVLGFFEAGHWPCALLTVRSILGEKNRTLGNGILQSGASLGAVLVPVYISITESWGKTWEFPFWSIGMAGLCWIPAWFFLVRGHDLMQIKSDSQQANQKPERLMSTSRLVRCVICLAIMIGSLNISWQFLRAWIIKFLVEFHGYTDTQSRVINVIYFLAADAGCLLSGALMTALLIRNWSKHNARLLGFFLFSLLTICGAAIPYVPPGILMTTLLCVTGAGILGLHPFYYSLTQELSAKHMGSLSGLLAAFGWVCSGRAQELIGKQIEADKSYETGLLMAGLAPLIGFAALALLWPAEGRARQDSPSHPTDKIPQDA